MEIAYRNDGETRTIDLPFASQISDLLSMIDIPPDSVLVTLANDKGVLEPVPITRVLNDGDSLELVTIASGG